MSANATPYRPSNKWRRTRLKRSVLTDPPLSFVPLPMLVDRPRLKPIDPEALRLVLELLLELLQESQRGERAEQEGVGAGASPPNGGP